MAATRLESNYIYITYNIYFKLTNKKMKNIIVKKKKIGKLYVNIYYNKSYRLLFTIKKTMRTKITIIALTYFSKQKYL